jgi:hypothetical protein
MFESIPIWSVVTVAGPIVLGLAIAYGLIRRRRLSGREREAQVRATERNYEKPEKV